MMIMRLTAVLLVAGVAAGGMWACGDESTSPSSIAGTYNLLTIDGLNLPVTVIQVDVGTVEVMSGFERLNTDGTFSESLTLRTTEDGQVSTKVATDGGSWTQSGPAIAFTYGGSGDTFTGSVSGDRLTITQEGVVFVFRK